MRYLLASAAILTAGPLFADTFEMKAPVVEATLYPQGASITRVAQGTLPEGRHEIVIPGLPPQTDPSSLRIEAQGLRLGAVSVQRDRALPDTGPDPDAVARARAEVERLERALRDRDAEIETIRAEIHAAQDVIDFLKALAGAEGAASGDVLALADTVGDRILDARRDAIDAETRAFAAAQSREQDQRRLDQARARLEALQQPRAPDDSAALVIAAEGLGTEARLRITATDPAASWSPVYDLRLDQQDGTLRLDRGVMVSQATGEDWSDVALTLSTARPSQRSAPSEIGPRIVRIIDPDDRRFRAKAEPAMEMAAADMAGAPAPIADSMVVDFMGGTAVYRYDAPVDLRDGADALRLELDRRDLPIDALVAEAVPLRDSTAYLVVDSTNTLDEVILPGPVSIRADGAMVGQSRLDLIAAGDEMKLSFGALDGVVLDRRTPEKQSGDRGMIRRSTALSETAVLSAENLTPRDYTLRLIDRVPVSEQEALQVEWQASVEPTETAPDGRRGVLIWEMPLAAGDRQEVTLETSMRWPEEMELVQ